MKKKVLMICLCLFAVVGARAQMLDVEDLVKYTTKFLNLPEDPSNKEWSKAAQKLKDDGTVAVDKNNALTWTEVIPAEGATKEQLYVILNYWYTMTFNNGKAAIQLNDKDAGTIIGQGFIANIVGHTGGMNKYQVNMMPVIKADIKDNKVRLTYTIQAFNVYKTKGAGVWGALSKGLSGVATPNETVAENWMISKCYPFVPEKEDKHEYSSAKAICMTTAFSDYIMNKIKEAVQHGLSGNENDDW